ncbi:vacuole effluxer Atg22 like protein [Variibacter gotjawalensis]|uniref:Vacuole effluxer Atg22 like protein n=1 Tax=Variibacter gotjawalensis TaxID=1333996 RepID=A0A0S3PQB5_9BRAD|nr:MFS transporter [Variibacter gotjawalensis]NIK48435.1 UMF1 family MFS transporter [Variibacter gotjawalensis]RZS50302.1 UMF1 family MFS transporter [Variibacter gotjawalensis]BAT58135.1 vacuole effluxer Atg22 like protein [Variibacter gotjawalensis]
MTFRGVPDVDPQPAPRRALFGWALFDWAAQPYFTLITTFIYAPYFANAVAANPVQGQAIWGYATAFAGLLIALGSPFLGGVADASGRRKPWILAFGCLLVVGSSCLWFGRPAAPETVPIVLLAFIIATIGTEFATVFNNAMMPTLVKPEQLGKLSGIGWATGYVGGVLSLFVMLLFMVGDPQTGKTLIGLNPIFGLDPAAREGDRAAGPLTAIWFVIFIIPMFLFTPDTPARMPVSDAMRQGVSRLREALNHLKEHPNTATFLIANMIYADGLVALFAFGGIFASSTFDWGTTELGIFGILTAISGTFGALIGGFLDNRLGSKGVVMISLGLLLCSVIAILCIGRDYIFWMTVAPATPGDGLFASAPEKMYVLIGIMIGFAAGPMQAASRTLLARLSPPQRMAQFFGLFALSGRVTSFLGPLLVGIVTAATASQRGGMMVLILFFTVGLVLLSRVKAPQP